MSSAISHSCFLRKRDFGTALNLYSKYLRSMPSRSRYISLLMTKKQIVAGEAETGRERLPLGPTLNPCLPCAFDGLFYLAAR